MPAMWDWKVVQWSGGFRNCKKLFEKCVCQTPHLLSTANDISRYVLRVLTQYEKRLTFDPKLSYNL